MTSSMRNSTQESCAAGDLRWGAPLWRMTYSVQNTARSLGEVGWSRSPADIFKTLSLYLTNEGREKAGELSLCIRNMWVRFELQYPREIMRIILRFY